MPVIPYIPYFKISVLKKITDILITIFPQKIKVSTLFRLKSPETPDLLIFSKSFGVPVKYIAQPDYIVAWLKLNTSFAVLILLNLFGKLLIKNLPPVRLVPEVSSPHSRIA
jgi:hypothetical protein